MAEWSKQIYYFGFIACFICLEIILFSCSNYTSIFKLTMSLLWHIYREWLGQKVNIVTRLLRQTGSKQICIWISSAHIQGKHNVVAGAERRKFDTELMWQLEPITFQFLQGISLLTCTLDLFGIKAECPNSYVSYRPDPGAFAVDAF